MPNSDKNILIVPNTNQNGLPNIQFVGSSSAPISLTVLDDNSLSFSGSQGQLFGINNNLTSGTIYSVNDVSGIPLLELNASGNMTFGQFGGNFSVGKSTANARLDVSGSTVITGSLTVVGTISASSFLGVSGGGGTPGGTNQTIQFNSGSTFSGSSNLIYNYTTNILSGTTAQFTNLTSSVVSASTYLGLPFANSTFTPSISANLASSRAFNTTYQNNTGRTLWVQIVLNCISTGTRQAFVNQDFNSVNNSTGTVVYNEAQDGGRNLTAHFYVPAGFYYKIITDTSANIANWYEYELFGGGGDVILSASNTFTGVNTFNTNFITASAGITGSVARFTTISGSVISASLFVGPGIGGATPGGTNQTIQFNSGSTFSGSTNLVWDYTNNRLGIGTTSPQAPIHSVGVNAGLETLIVESTTSTGNNIIRYKNAAGNLGYVGWASTSNDHFFIANQKPASNITLSTSNDIILVTSSSERLRVTSTGNVGIGTTSPNASLSVKGAGTGIVDIGQWSAVTSYGVIYLNGDFAVNNNYNILSSPTDKRLLLNRPTGEDISFRMNNVDQMTLDSNGRLGIGTATPNAKLDVNGNTIISGNLTVTGSITELSTRRIKTNITSLNDELTTIFKLNPVSYTRIDDGRKEYGFISEEVKEIYPEFVVGEGINYPKMVSVLVSAVKELTNKVQQQQTEIELIKSRGNI
jgi:hypothetical protein